MNPARLILFAAAMIPCASALAADWSSPASGDWSNPANWSPTDVPDSAAEDAIINALGGPYQVDMDGDFSIGALTVDSPDAALHMPAGNSLEVTTGVAMHAGTLDIDGELNFAGNGTGQTFDFHGGTINGVVHINSAGVKLASSGISSGTFSLFGAATHIAPLAPGTATTPAGVTIISNSNVQDVYSEVRFRDASSYVNNGTWIFNSIGGFTGVTFRDGAAQAPVTNNGVISFNSNSSSTVLHQTASGLFLNAPSGTININGSTGSLGVGWSNQGQFNIEQGKVFKQSDFYQNSGTLNVEGTLRTRNFKYAGGNITGDGVIEFDQGGWLDINAAGPNGPSGGTFEFFSTFEHQAAVIDGYGTSSSNRVGGDILPGMKIILNTTVIGSPTSSPLIANIYHENYGEIVLEASDNIRAIEVRAFLSFYDSFENYGVIRVKSGATGGERKFVTNLHNHAAGRIELLTDTDVLGDSYEISGALDNEGTIAVQLAPALFGRLDLEGIATLAGTLEISLADGFDPITAPPAQQTFQIMSFASRTGEFDDVLGQYVDDGYYWNLLYTATTLTLELTQASPGDTDLDGDVDLADLGTLATYYEQAGAFNWLDGDFDGDGDVDLVDLGALAGNYEGGSTQAYADFTSMATVPEPGGAGAALLALLAYIRRSKQR